MPMLLMLIKKYLIGTAENFTRHRPPGKLSPLLCGYACVCVYVCCTVYVPLCSLFLMYKCFGRDTIMHWFVAVV
jgi:hypothetical protein